MDPDFRRDDILVGYIAQDGSARRNCCSLFLAEIAEPEEHAATPDAALGFAVDVFLSAERDPHIEIGEFDRRPSPGGRRIWARQTCGGFARSVVFHQSRGDAARREGSDSLNTSVNATSAGLVAEIEGLGERLRLVRERIG